MLLVPRADVDEIRTFLIEHFAVVVVPVLLAHIEEIAKLAAGIGVGVGNGADFCGLSGYPEPATGVDAGDDTAGDDGGTVLRHRMDSCEMEKVDRKDRPGGPGTEGRRGLQTNQAVAAVTAAPRLAKPVV